MSQVSAQQRPGAATRYASPGRSESIRRYRNRASLSVEEVESGEWKSFLYSSGADSPQESVPPAVPVAPARRRMSTSKKGPPYQLVVIGGGVAGASVAKELSRSKFFQVVLVDAVPYFENKLPILNYLVDSTMEATKAVASQMSRHDEYLRSAIESGKATVKISTVKEVNMDTVVLADETVPYDYLVVASGREYMIQRHHSLSTRSLNELAMHLKKTEKVLIIGGGS
jgi:pyruvate/2-oxoglutarate dehydrogenase complex dihydrolipoamide dehydrogenase (E3) component